MKKTKKLLTVFVMTVLLTLALCVSASAADVPSQDAANKIFKDLGFCAWGYNGYFDPDAAESAGVSKTPDGDVILQYLGFKGELEPYINQETYTATMNFSDYIAIVDKHFAQYDVEKIEAYMRERCEVFDEYGNMTWFMGGFGDAVTWIPTTYKKIQNTVVVTGIQVYYGYEEGQIPEGNYGFDYVDFIDSDGRNVYGDVETKIKMVLVEDDGIYKIKSYSKTDNYEYNGITYYDNGTKTTLKEVNGVWGYYVNDVLDTSYTGLVDFYNVLYYVENGEINWSATNLTSFEGDLYYVEEGKVNWECDTLFNYSDVWYYVLGGKVTEDYTGLVNYYGTWYYVENGVLNWNATTLTNYGGTWYYVENGILNWNSDTLVLFGGVWYYARGGVVAWDYTGLVSYYGTWYYVENGVLNWNATTLTNYGGTWYYVENGVLNWGGTTLVNYYGTWYYVENGLLNWNSNTLVYYGDNWYYTVNGTVAWGETTLVLYYGTWYYVENGVLNRDAQTLVNYDGTWYFVSDGSVAWGFTGICEYYGAIYYIENGVLNWGFTGAIIIGTGDIIYIENGVFNYYFNGILYLDEFGIYMENGIAVDYTGYVPSGNEWVYVQNGIVYY